MIKQKNNEKIVIGEEVDLVLLLKTLYQGKRLIIISTLLFCIIGVFYVLFTAKYFVVDKTVNAEKFLIINRVGSNELSMLQEYPNLNIDFAKVKNNILKDFSGVFNSNKNKQLYLSSIRHLNNNEATVNFVKNNIEINNLENNKVNIRFKSDFNNKEIDIQTINDYISFTIKKVENNISKEIENKISIDKENLNSILLSLEDRAKLKIRIEIKETQYALKIAKAANIIEPISQLNNNELFAIDLGSKALSEKLKILEKTKDFDIFEPEIGLVKLELQKLGKFNDAINIEFKKDNLNNELNIHKSQYNIEMLKMVIIFSMIGFVIGLFGVLFKFNVKK